MRALQFAVPSWLIVCVHRRSRLGCDVQVADGDGWGRCHWLTASGWRCHWLTPSMAGLSLSLESLGSCENASFFFFFLQNFFPDFAPLPRVKRMAARGGVRGAGGGVLACCCGPNRSSSCVVVSNLCVFVSNHPSHPTIITGTTQPGVRCSYLRYCSGPTAGLVWSYRGSVCCVMWKLLATGSPNPYLAMNAA
jgi:hypothetical protein